MDDNQKKAFDLAADTTKQLISLSSGIIAVTITFQKEVFKDSPNEVKVLLYISWLLYFASIIFGILTMMALTGTIERHSPGASGDRHIWRPDWIIGDSKSKNKLALSIYSKNITIMSATQIITFVMAVLFTLAFGIVSTQVFTSTVVLPAASPSPMPGHSP